MPDSTLFRVSGYRGVHREPHDAHSFAQLHTRRISQLNGLNCSTGSSISPLRAAAILPKIFMTFRELRGTEILGFSEARVGGDHFTGTRCFSSSSQLTTTWICVEDSGGSSSSFSGSTTINRLPSLEMS